MTSMFTPEQEMQRIEAESFIKRNLPDVAREVYNTLQYKHIPGPNTIKAASLLSRFQNPFEIVGNLTMLTALRFIMFNRSGNVVAANLKQFGEENEH